MIGGIKNDKEVLQMNYMFLDKYDIRNYLDKEVGIDISDEIFDVITKEEFSTYCKIDE